MELSDLSLYACVALVGYVPLLYAAGSFTCLLSKRIRNDSELERAIASERRLYDQENTQIVLEASFDPENPNHCLKIDDRTYRVSAMSFTALRHELAHIFSGHLKEGNFSERRGIEKVKRYAQYFVLYEPAAIIQSIIKPQRI